MKNVFSILLLTAIFLTSCGEDDGETDTNVDLTTEEASAAILETGELAAADLVSMTDSEGIAALNEFASLFADFDQFSGREEKQNWIKSKFKTISHYFVAGPAGRINEDEFVFDDIKGVYDWNPDIEDFDKTEESEFFIVNFPSEGSATNNAELKIIDLQFITVTETDEWGSYTEDYPTSVDGSLKVDGETYVSVKASASWSDDGAPIKGDIDLLVSPFTFTLEFDDSEATKISGSASLSKDDQKLMAVDLGIDFKSSEKEEPSAISGFVQYSNVKVAGDIDVAGYDENAYDSNGDMIDGFDGSEYINLEVLIDDEKVGDISFEEDIPYIIYLDGTKENLEELLESVIADMEEAFEDFEEGED